ncbi:hypothetical protein DSM104329_02041 [Capillimicrobium parvum]|uniref:Integrase n=1 Tax=Capillimicrobium parvum TaxID=2884022 RepID=A0A9E6XXK3_9ACTN|nr:hypothetical protein DSM104329_02041 [Capillimicrobium parvum]
MPRTGLRPADGGGGAGTVRAYREAMRRFAELGHRERALS